MRIVCSAFFIIAWFFLVAFLFTFKDGLILLFCVSISSFVENSGEFAVAMVDHLLDILTKGEHSKAKQQLEEVSISV